MRSSKRRKRRVKWYATWSKRALATCHKSLPPSFLFLSDHHDQNHAFSFFYLFWVSKFDFFFFFFFAESLPLVRKERAQREGAPSDVMFVICTICDGNAANVCSPICNKLFRGFAKILQHACICVFICIYVKYI